ncbi:MAG TPA: hypothetical protein VG796_28005 [Verrucomicrobiales bacterium]|jgi:hypothetical protein|nr:hypothetical protein [Verrucomicrobiales bacterium]
MPRLSPELKEFQQRRDLVSIERAGIDAYSIQAFILDFSRELVLLQKIDDFRPDGLLVLRCADISGCKSGATNQFQKTLLQEEGVLEKVDFRFRAPLQSFDSFLNWLPPDEIVILEDELCDKTDFLIGPVLSVDESVVSIRYITGAGNWENEPQEMSIDRITSCQIRSSYISFYARYVQRQERKES